MIQYTITVLLRLLYTPVVLVICLVKYGIAVQQEKLLVIRIEEDVNRTKGSATVTAREAIKYTP